MRTCLLLLSLRTSHEYHGALIAGLQERIQDATPSIPQQPEALAGGNVVILPVNWDLEAKGLVFELKPVLSSEVIEDYAVLSCGSDHACKSFRQEVEFDEASGLTYTEQPSP
jgi:hypothetical protein